MRGKAPPGETEGEEGHFVCEDGTVISPGWVAPIGVRNYSDILANQNIRGPFFGVFIWNLVFALLSVLFTFALGLVAVSMVMLVTLVNALTAALTFAAFIGYAVIYTAILKPATPQNIVIGGASGAMPPVLGWAAATGEVHHDALLLFLIIFAWTPPHFWALALYRRDEYAKAGLPMLPVTHGEAYTRLHVLLYTLLLFAVTMLPVGTGMGGWIYLVGAVLLGGGFIAYGWRLYRHYSDALAKETFRYSIWYLSVLFAVMLLDHYFRLAI